MPSKATASDRSVRERPEIRFGRVLAQLRRDRGLSQDDLAAQCGYSRAYISLLERGLKSPSLRTIFDLGATLEISPSQIIKAIEKS